tara:strand:+ start:590 stop:817 length:228 start_codon:yes stop_codon:yes gene_type:complete
METVTNYVRTTNSKKIICFYGKRESFRCRQRTRMCDGTKPLSLKFVSYKEMLKEIKKGNTEKVVGPYHFDTMSKL